jgi:urease accessory protein
MANSTPTGQKPETSGSGPPSAPASATDLHTLLLLADSALPLGSFAFSSGLESFLAHQPSSSSRSRFSPSSTAAAAAAAQRFLPLSLLATASATLPYLLAAHRDPRSVGKLDDELDAATLCAVARRASVAQGRALLALWERCFAAHYAGAGPVAGAATEDGRDGRGGEGDTAGAADARAALQELCEATRDAGGRPSSPPSSSPCDAATLEAGHGHFPVAWGAVTRAMGLDARTAAYAFLLAHARGLLGAAVRAGALGPYHAQAELADPRLRARVGALVERFWSAAVADAAQAVPALDLWVGRHEKLYSRIFNS